MTSINSVTCKYKKGPSDAGFDPLLWQRKDWPLMPWSRYKISKFLGSGRYGIVAMADHEITQTSVVAKQIRHVFGGKGDGNSLVHAIRSLREIAMMAYANHPNVGLGLSLGIGACLGLFFITIMYTIFTQIYEACILYSVMSQITA